MSKIDFILERFIHVVLKGDSLPSRKLLTDALDAGQSPQSILCEILWPALQCAHQLRSDCALPPRLYNAASRTLRSLIDHIATLLPHQPATARSVLVISAQNHSDELGAHLISTLAESHGWTVYFGGANLSLEEITFSIGQLNPDTLLLHADTTENSNLEHLLAKLHRIRIWPKVQIAVVGDATGKNLMADLHSANPLEILELMALCPEYRADPISPQTPASPLHMLTSDTPSIHVSQHAIARLISHHLRNLPTNPN